MNSVPKQHPVVIFIGVLVAAFLLNFASVKLGLKPYLYCGFRDMVWAMYQPLQLLISLAGILGLLWFGARRNWGSAFLAVLVTLFAYLGPEWTRILFSVGRGCA